MLCKATIEYLITGNYNPYSSGNTLNVGDHVLSLSAGYSTTQDGIQEAMLFYTNGAIQSQLYEGFENNYNQVY